MVRGLEGCHSKSFELEWLLLTIMTQGHDRFKAKILR